MNRYLVIHASRILAGLFILSCGGAAKHSGPATSSSGSSGTAVGGVKEDAYAYADGEGADSGPEDPAVKAPLGYGGEPAYAEAAVSAPESEPSPDPAAPPPPRERVEVEETALDDGLMAADEGGDRDAGSAMGGIGFGGRRGAGGRGDGDYRDRKKEKRSGPTKSLGSPAVEEAPTEGARRPPPAPKLGGMVARRPPVAAPAMKAGRHDDNNQYNRFLQFLGENRHLVVYPLDISERLVVRVVDKDGKSKANCRVDVKNTKGKRVASNVTYADGRTHFFPTAIPPADQDKDFILKALCDGKERNSQIARAGRRETDVVFREARAVPKRVPVDIAIVIDTTGSMGSQIDRLKKTLQAIHFQLTSLPTQPDIRFGMVAYRDRGDSYVTQVTGFNDNVDEFQRIVDRLDADGGGDTPEDLQAGLDKAMHELNWRPDALRLGFIVADAVPHTDYGQQFNYREAMQEALRRGIKWVTVGAGGLPRSGEVIFRQIAQHTFGEYVFVTQSGGGDREGGVGEASHHVGTNYKTENLDQAIVRIVRRELSYLTDEPKDFDYTVVATGDKTTPREAVLAPAVKELLRQLADYSSMRLEAGMPVAIVPVISNDDGYKDVAGYLTDELTLAASRNPSFKVVERDLNTVAQEHRIQMSELFDPSKAVPLGNMLGAELLIMAKLTVSGDSAQLFAKLVRVETGEMLSVAKADLVGGIVKRS